MAPQQRNPVLNEDGNTGMRRVDSEASDMSELGNDTRAQDYRIRKSSLIGYVFDLCCTVLDTTARCSVQPL
jgi:hypothetical protein